MKTSNKTRRFLVRVALAATIVVALAGCGMAGETQEDIARSFISRVNSASWSSIQSLLDSSASSYNTANTASYWSTRVALRPYTITGVSGSNSLTLTVSDTNGDSDTFVFTFSGSEGDLFTPSDFKIRTITYGGSPIFS